MEVDEKIHYQSPLVIRSVNQRSLKPILCLFTLFAFVRLKLKIFSSVVCLWAPCLWSSENHALDSSACVPLFFFPFSCFPTHQTSPAPPLPSVPMSPVLRFALCHGSSTHLSLVPSRRTGPISRWVSRMGASVHNHPFEAPSPWPALALTSQCDFSQLTLHWLGFQGWASLPPCAPSSWLKLLRKPGTSQLKAWLSGAPWSLV